MKSNQTEQRVALFAGSFDPFTKGHEAIVEAALRLFDEVVVGIGSNVAKSALLDVEQRKRLIDDLYSGEERVSSAIYGTLTVDFAREIGATALIRGVRGVADLEAERTLESVNRGLAPELQTVLLLTPAEVAHISSSCVRELLAFGKEVDMMMPRGIELKNYML
ncbi:MAG: pantetheine-phosphate adenylyltransferase [Rikenellaceae bacterium]